MSFTFHYCKKISGTRAGLLSSDVSFSFSFFNASVERLLIKKSALGCQTEQHLQADVQIKASKLHTQLHGSLAIWGV